MRSALVLLALTACWTSSPSPTSPVDREEGVHKPARVATSDAAVDAAPNVDLQAVLSELERQHQPQNVNSALPALITHDVFVVGPTAATTRLFTVQQAQQMGATWSLMATNAKCMFDAPRRIACASSHPPTVFEYCFVLVSPTTARYSLSLVRVTMAAGTSTAAQSLGLTVPSTSCPP